MPNDRPVINSIEGARARVLTVVCPYCCAAVGAKCTQRVFNAGGLQTQFTDIFHAERVYLAQSIAEKAMALTQNIRRYLNKKADQGLIKIDKSTEP